MKIFFLRHGLADRNAWSGSDFARPLTAHGKERMARQAITIAQLSLGIDLILTSPLKRARQTAEIVAAELSDTPPLIEEERLGFAFDRQLLAEILADHPAAEAPLLVGHEPSFSETISDLTGGSFVVCKKGSLARVDLRPGASLQGDLVWLIPPKLLAR